MEEGALSGLVQRESQLRPGPVCLHRQCGAFHWQGILYSCTIFLGVCVVE